VIRYAIRVDLYQDAEFGKPPSGYVGSLLSGDFAGQALPRSGDSISALPVGGAYIGPWTSGPYMRVDRVEHHPVPVDLEGMVVEWWDKYPHPSVHVVINAEWPAEEADEHALMTVFEQQGWQNFPAGPDNPFISPTSAANF
jgi:hypothetical protein